MTKNLYSLVTTILGPRVEIEHEPSVKYGIKKETLIELCKLYKGNKHPIMYHLKLSRFKLNNLLKHYKININEYKEN